MRGSRSLWVIAALCATLAIGSVEAPLQENRAEAKFLRRIKVQARQFIHRVRNTFNRAKSAVRSAVNRVKARLEKVWTQAKATLYGGYWSSKARYVESLQQQLQNLPAAQMYDSQRQSLRNLIATVKNEMRDIERNRGRQIVNRVRQRVQNTVGRVAHKVQATVQKAKVTVQKAAQKVKAGVQKVAQTVKATVQKVAQTVKAGVQKVAQTVKATVQKVAQKAKATVQKVAQKAKATVQKVKDQVKAEVARIKNKVKEKLQAIRQFIDDKIKPELTKVWEKAENLWLELKAGAKNLIGRAKEKFAEVKEKLISLFREWTHKLIDKQEKKVRDRLDKHIRKALAYVNISPEDIFQVVDPATGQVRMAVVKKVVRSAVSRALDLGIGWAVRKVFNAVWELIQDPIQIGVSEIVASVADIPYVGPFLAHVVSQGLMLGIDFLKEKGLELLTKFVKEYASKEVLKQFDKGYDKLLKKYPVVKAVVARVVKTAHRLVTKMKAIYVLGQESLLSAARNLVQGKKIDWSGVKDTAKQTKEFLKDSFKQTKDLFQNPVQSDPRLNDKAYQLVVGQTKGLFTSGKGGAK